LPWFCQQDIMCRDARPSTGIVAVEHSRWRPFWRSGLV